jgi:hypothetical protein
MSPVLARRKVGREAPPGASKASARVSNPSRGSAAAWCSCRRRHLRPPWISTLLVSVWSASRASPFWTSQPRIHGAADCRPSAGTGGGGQSRLDGILAGTPVHDAPETGRAWRRPRRSRRARLRSRDHALRLTRGLLASISHKSVTLFPAASTALIHPDSVRSPNHDRWHFVLRRASGKG